MAKNVSRKKRSGSKLSPEDQLARESLLVDLRLIEAHAQQADELRPSELPSEIAANALVTTSSNEEQKRYRVEVTFDLHMSYTNAADRPVIHVLAKYRITLGCEKFELATKEAVGRFGQGGAIFILWPYWRQHVTNTLSTMGLPSFSLPLYRTGFFQSMEEVEQAEVRQ